MILCAESNFVLELALSQEEAADADRLLAMAENGDLQLVIPAFSLCEPHETLARRAKEREITRTKLTAELRQLARSEQYTQLSETLDIVTRALTESGEIQARALAATIDRILRGALVLPMTPDIVRDAAVFQIEYQLSAQDSLIFASIDRFLRDQSTGAKVFVTRDRKDFQNAQIETHFDRYQCKLLSSFSIAQQFAQHTLSAN